MFVAHKAPKARVPLDKGAEHQVDNNDEDRAYNDREGAKWANWIPFMMTVLNLPHSALLIAAYSYLQNLTSRLESLPNIQ